MINKKIMVTLFLLLIVISAGCLSDSTQSPSSDVSPSGGVDTNPAVVGEDEEDRAIEIPADAIGLYGDNPSEYYPVNGNFPDIYEKKGYVLVTNIRISRTEVSATVRDIRTGKISGSVFVVTFKDDKGVLGRTGLSYKFDHKVARDPKTLRATKVYFNFR